MSRIGASRKAPYLALTYVQRFARLLSPRKSLIKVPPWPRVPEPHLFGTAAGRNAAETACDTTGHTEQAKRAAKITAS